MAGLRQRHGSHSLLPRWAPAHRPRPLSTPPPPPTYPGCPFQGDLATASRPATWARHFPASILPAPSHLLSSRSYAMASPQENRPVRCPQETLVSEHGGVGQGRSLSSPAPLPPSIQASEQGAASSIQFSFHTSLPLENGSHHPGRPPSCLCPHPLPGSPHSQD